MMKHSLKKNILKLIKFKIHSKLNGAPKQQMMWHHINPKNLKIEKKKSVHPNVMQTHPALRNWECKGTILAGIGTSDKHFYLKQEKEPLPFICVF